MIQTRADKITMLQNLQRGIQQNSDLKAICRQCLPLGDVSLKSKLEALIADPFTSSSLLYEAANDIVLGRLLDVINSSKGEADVEAVCKLEVELLERLLKYKPQ